MTKEVGMFALERELANAPHIDHQGAALAESAVQAGQRDGTGIAGAIMRLVAGLNSIADASAVPAFHRLAVAQALRAAASLIENGVWANDR